MPEYDLRPVTTDDESIRASAALLRVAFPASSSVYSNELVGWEYAGNPAGAIVGFNAFAGSELAAHYVAQPLVANLHGRRQRGLLSMNTATHPAHQGKKLFTRLAEETYRAATEAGFEFVVGVANANSTPGFVRKLGFQLVHPLEARVGLGAMTRSDEGSSPALCFERIWTAESLEWRVAHPGTAYSIRERRILSPTGRLGIQAILGEFPAALLEGLSPVGKPGWNPARLWLGLDPRVDLRRSRYLQIPRKLRPSPLNLIFKDLSGKNDALDGATVKFQAIDFDAY